MGRGSNCEDRTLLGKKSLKKRKTCWNSTLNPVDYNLTAEENLERNEIFCLKMFNRFIPPTNHKCFILFVLLFCGTFNFIFVSHSRQKDDDEEEEEIGPFHLLFAKRALFDGGGGEKKGFS